MTAPESPGSLPELQEKLLGLYAPPTPFSPDEIMEGFDGYRSGLSYEQLFVSLSDLFRKHGSIVQPDDSEQTPVPDTIKRYDLDKDWGFGVADPEKDGER